MATPNAVFTELVTTTVKKQGNMVVDNVVEHNALLRAMKEKGNIKAIDGGTTVCEPIAFDENQTYMEYSGAQVLNTGSNDVLTSVEYDWCQAYMAVTATGREININSGDSAIINLAKAKIKIAKTTAANRTNLALYSDGSIPNQIGGLGLIIQPNGLGTVGGINAANYPFWRNQFHEIGGTNAWTSATIINELDKAHIKCVNGVEKPDFCVMTHDFYTAFSASLQNNRRYMSDKDAKSGFSGLIHNGMTIYHDSNASFGTTAEKAYLVNSDYLMLVEHKAARWQVGEQKSPVNQDAVVVPLYWMGALVCTNRKRQGIMIDAA